MAAGHGGARRGAGRKPDGYVPPMYPPAADGSDDDDGDGAVSLSFERERAHHEKIKREEREFKLATLRGEYLHRAMVGQASATALSVLTQSLRSIPDNLERVCGLTPEQAEIAQKAVDAALAEVALAFRVMAGDQQ